MPDLVINEIALSLRWTVTVRNIDGAAHIILRVEHPRAGPLDFLISSKDALDLGAALAKIAETRDEARIGRAVAVTSED
jgi:hypothetical protein